MQPESSPQPELKIVPSLPKEPAMTILEAEAQLAAVIEKYGIVEGEDGVFRNGATGYGIEPQGHQAYMQAEADLASARAAETNDQAA